MANERQKRLMQEALDQSISAENQQELLSHLQRNPQDAAQFDRLREVDKLLRNAPMERAPKRMAMNIMARLAETVMRGQLSRISGLALALGLALATLVTLPVLLLAGWLILSAVGSAATLTTIIQQVVGLLSLVIAALEIFTRQMQTLLVANPAVPAVIVPIIPLTLWWLLRFTPDRDEHGNL